MAHVWTQTIAINQDLARQLVVQQTSLNVFSLEVFGQGWDNIAYLVNKEYIFRFPGRQMGVDCMDNEIAILPYIATKVSFPFSCPQYIGKRSESYPAPFAGYKMVPGIPLSDTHAVLIDDANFACTLATWLKELHAVPVLEHHLTELKGDQSWRYDVPGKLVKSRARIAKYESCFLDAGFSIDELLGAIHKLSLLNYENLEKNSYIHGDLYSRHLLIDERKNLSGIIDWGDIHIGNPGDDLSVGFFIFSDDALQLFFATYGNSTNAMRNIAILRVFYNSIALLPYCYDMQEEQLKSWGILALKRALDFIEHSKK